MHERFSVERTEAGTTAEWASNESTVRIRHRAGMVNLTFSARSGDTSATGHGSPISPLAGARAKWLPDERRIQDFEFRFSLVPIGGFVVRNI